MIVFSTKMQARSKFHTRSKKRPHLALVGVLHQQVIRGSAALLAKHQHGKAYDQDPSPGMLLVKNTNNGGGVLYFECQKRIKNRHSNSPCGIV
jgi:hypothetical protein